jgi:CRISPR type III-B/RAMP module-associated protein Cmr5
MEGEGDVHAMGGDGLTVSQQESVDRARAAFAYERVLAAMKGGGERYRALAEKLPSMLQVNGLGPTLAFLAAKGSCEQKAKGGGQTSHLPSVDEGKAEGRLFGDLDAWLTRAEWPQGPYNRAAANEEPAGGFRLMRRVTGGDGLTYRRATLEALALASWLKRLSAALIERGGKGD